MKEYKVNDPSNAELVVTITTRGPQSKASKSPGVIQRLAGSRPATKTTTAATLPLPEELLYSSQLDWSIEGQSIVQALASDYLTGDNVPTKGEITNVLLKRILAQAGSAFGVKSALQRQGVATDPLKEIFFSGANNRSFTWNWKLAPKNAKEATTIEEMIKALQVAATPSSKQFGLFNIPDEFHVTFPSKLKLPKIKPCVCNEISVNYFDGGKARFQKDGHPSFIMLTMQLTELEIPLKKDFQ